MDGTLIDSREIILGAFKHVLEEFGGEYDEAVVSTHVGRVLNHTYEDLLPGHEAEKLIALHRSWQADNKDLFKGFSGLEDFLSAIKNLGLKLGLFTSAARTRTDLSLDGLNIRNYFDAIVCMEDVKKAKPDKEGIVTTTKLMGVSPGEVIMVGDAEYDILSGKNAGVITIGITHGFGTKQALQEAGADYIVNNLQELLKKLEEL